jgi:hypothetical protein
MNTDMASFKTAALSIFQPHFSTGLRKQILTWALKFIANKSLLLQDLHYGKTYHIFPSFVTVSENEGWYLQVMGTLQIKTVFFHVLRALV